MITALLLAFALHQTPDRGASAWGINDLMNWCSEHGDACLGAASYNPAVVAHRPNPTLTPGVTRNLSRDAVCATKWGKDRRHVTLGMKKAVFASYGIPWADHSKYEVDHDISRELGGADDVRNLWPQPWDGTWNAHQKDRLENALHRKVCDGDMTLSFAQQAISSDWIAAYRLYVP